MDPTITSGLTKLGTNLISGLFQNYLDDNTEDKSYQRQLDLLNRQNLFNLAQWERNNKYNDPKNQLARLLGAGLTPSGAVAALTGNTSQPIVSSNPGAPTSIRRSAGDYLSSSADIALESLRAKAEIDNIKADTENKNADTETKNATRIFEVEKLKNESNKIISEINLNEKQTEEYNILLKYLDKKEQAEIDLILENKKKIEQETTNLKYEEKKLIWEQYFRDNFGIDPNSSLMNNLVTATLKGTEEPIFNAIEKTVNIAFNKLKEYGTLVTDTLGDKLSTKFPATVSPIYNHFINREWKQDDLNYRLNDYFKSKAKYRWNQFTKFMIGDRHKRFLIKNAEFIPKKNK